MGMPDDGGGIRLPVKTRAGRKLVGLRRRVTWMPALGAGMTPRV